MMGYYFRSFSRWVFIAGILGIGGCTGLPRKPIPPAPGGPVQPAAPSGPPQQLLIFIPQTDEGASSWFKLFAQYPSLRMVIALSPRFIHFAKDPALRSRAVELQKAGRLELALQVPNPPFFPLLINTHSAKDALPPGASLPDPPFAFPEDATQILAHSRGDFYRLWTIAPKGVVLPQGAASEELFNVVSRLGFQWTVGALGTSMGGGAYRTGSLLVWDATPLTESPQFTIQVWDERVAGNSPKSLQTLTLWAETLEKKKATPILPSDPGLPTFDLPKDVSWGKRTWTTKDWNPWIGTPRKNAAWEWLRITREALEAFKNSGQASVKRLDMAFEEFYTAENSNYLLDIGNPNLPVGAAEEREREFKATLSAVYRLMGQSPPEDLFNADIARAGTAVKLSSSAALWEALPDGREHVLFEDPAGDDHGDGSLADPAGPKGVPGTYDLRRLEVWISSDTLDWNVTMGSLASSSLGDSSKPGPLIDIYVDLNGQPNVGTLSFLPGRRVIAAPSDAWEYCLSLWDTKAQLYRTRSEGTYELAETFSLLVDSGSVHVRMPRSWMRGNPKRWGYQALVMSYDPKSPEGEPQPLIPTSSKFPNPLPIFDLLDGGEISQSQLLTDIEEGRRQDVPFVHVNAK